MKGTSTGAEQVGKDVYLDFLATIFEPGKPLAKLISTDVGYFLYDTGTNKILGCKEEVAFLLHGLFTNDVSGAYAVFTARYGEKAFLDAVAEIEAVVNNENILKVKIASRFGLSDHFGNVKEILNTTVQSVCLELTQACNCRCLYCPYSDFYKGKRNHGEKIMSLETAKKAIDFLKDHSSKSESVAVGFYGGEPLLQFDLLKKCVTYAKEIIDIKKLSFNITTNATLVTPEIAEYLLENRFLVVVSLDGPKELHDRYRKDNEGKGSYEKTINGLKILAEKRQKTRKGQVSINAVYTPPYSEKKIAVIHDHIKNLEWLPAINMNIVYPNEGTIPIKPIERKNSKQDKDMIQWAFDNYRVKFENSDVMVRGIIERDLAHLMQRSVYTKPLDAYSLNGCCLPGQLKNFIDTDGGIYVCEKISTLAPAIGHVDTGFDFDTIKKVYIDDYAEKSIKDCSHCWAIRMCGLCYFSAYNDEGKMDLGKKRKSCIVKLKSLQRTIRHFIILMEENPEKLKYLTQFSME